MSVCWGGWLGGRGKGRERGKGGREEREGERKGRERGKGGREGCLRVIM